MKKTLLLIAAVTALSTLSFVMKDNGLAGRTGSPGETTCNTAGCHTGNTLNDPSGSISISAPGLDANWEYAPGSTYQIQVTVSRTGNTKFGLGFESLLSSGANAGTLTITDPAQTQIKTATVSGNVRNNVVHKTGGGTSNDSHTFTFDWTAPPTGSGNVKFYAAGNAADGLTNPGGDYIFTMMQELEEESGSGVAESNFNSNLSVHPNPVKDIIQLTFSVTKPSNLVLSLVNLQGETIQRLAERPFSAGSHQFSEALDANVNNGVYLLKAESSGLVAYRKVVVLR